MKKTLAAVLAAAMALSTATVAFAVDYGVDPDIIDGSVSGSGVSLTGKIGGDKTFVIRSITVEETGKTIDGEELAVAMRNGDITAAVIVTDNQKNLSGRPSITAGKSDANQTLKKDVKYLWDDTTWDPANAKRVWSEIKDLDVSSVAANSEVKVVCLDKDGNLANSAADVEKIVKKGDKDYASIMADLTENTAWFVASYDTAAVKGELSQLKVSFIHTYGTSSINAKMKLRFTVKNKDGVTLGTETYNKGDTITSELITVTAQYYGLSNYYEDMQLTEQEVDARRVILEGKELYNEIGNNNFSITFGDDVAVFTAKLAATQKDVNLWYDMGEISAITDKYPNVDFEFITFKSKDATFVNTGTMYFAAEDKDYQVYSWDGEVLEPLTGKFDPTYKVIEVKGIKKLGTYVIADQILEVEEEPEEPAEPVDSTPVAEPDDEGQNPNTGAC